MALAALSRVQEAALRCLRVRHRIERLQLVGTFVVQSVGNMKSELETDVKGIFITLGKLGRCHPVEKRRIIPKHVNQSSFT